jgi:hypothetical protein
MGKIKFSAKTFGFTSKVKMRADIMQAAESSSDLRKEIARVFQMANRRIQNIESKGLLSPAVLSLPNSSVEGFSKFNMKHSWNELKSEYAQAVSFLKQPTSTASGTREYNRHLQQTYDLSSEEFDLMAAQLNNKLLSVDDTEFVEKYLKRYKDFTGDLEAAVSDVSQQMETDAVRLQNAIDEDLIGAVDEYANAQEQLEDNMQHELDRIMRNLEKFGL